MISPRLGDRRRRWIVGCLFFVSIVMTRMASGQTPQPCERAVLTQAEAADLLRVDPEEVARLAEQGTLPARRIGSAWRFGCAALMAWLNGDWKPQALTAPEMAQLTGAGIAVGQTAAPPSTGTQS